MTNAQYYLLLFFVLVAPVIRRSSAVWLATIPLVLSIISRVYEAIGGVT